MAKTKIKEKIKKVVDKIKTDIKNSDLEINFNAIFSGNVDFHLKNLPKK